MRLAEVAPATVANLAWGASLLAEARAFEHATHDVCAAQTRLLRALVRQQAASAFGRQHDLARVRSLSDLRHALPLRDYEDHRPYVERIAAGETNVLSSSPVRCLEPTSGSVAAAKLIPATDALRRAFTRGIAAWLVDLFRSDPRLLSGPAYWALSPALQPDARSPGGLPIGFEDDSAYLGPLGRLLARATLAVPSAVRHLHDPIAFRHATLLHLLRCAELRLVSVWNPSFMTLLLDAVAEHGEALASDLERGTCQPPGAAAQPHLDMPPAPARAAALRRALVDHGGDQVARGVWPELRLVSCWRDANAAVAAEQLAARLPHARMQGQA